MGMTRSTVATLYILAGVALVAVGIALVFAPAAFVAVGLSLLALGFADLRSAR
jgi:uncharacterized membrane-anchored protein YitT (DUF2179 family)